MTKRMNGKRDGGKRRGEGEREKIEEDHEDGCFNGEKRDVRGEEENYGEAPEPLR